MHDQDTLSPEDSAALVHAQQQLYSAGDPRAAKLYNYIVQAGYATKGDNGELHPQGETKSFYDKYLKGSLSGEAGWQQGIDKAAQSQPIDTSSVSGFAKSVGNNLGTGTTRLLLSPLAHPLNTAGGLAKSALQDVASPGLTSPATDAMVEQFRQNPSGEAVAALPQVALAVAGAGEAQPAAAKASNAVVKTTDAIANTPQTVKNVGAKFLPSLVDGPPESLVTRAVKPGKNNVGWNADVQKAIPLMKSAEETLGKTINGVDDALEAAKAAKKNIWQQYQARLGPAAQQGFRIDGNQIADAMLNSIDKRTAVQNPGLVAKVKSIADTYRKPMTLDQAEDFLQSANKDLNSYYAKNKVGQNVALNDPEISSTVAEAEALRKTLYSKLDQVTGPGAAQLKQAYGSLSNVEKELYGRQLVAARQNPESLSEQLSTVRGAGKIVKGVFTASPGDVLEGAENIAVSRALKARNSSDAMIARAFQKAQPARPFPMPSFRAPQSRLLLPEQAGGKIPALAPDPGMSGGEQIAALMHLLRQKGQLALPAKTVPIQLPPQF